MICRCRPIT